MKVFAPWKRDGDTFYPMSLEYLATSTFALGHFEAYSKTIGTTNVSIAVYSKWAATTQKKLAETAFRIFDYQTNLFGKSVGEQYLGVFSPVADDGKPIWGGEYSQSQGVSIFPDELDNFTPGCCEQCEDGFSHVAKLELGSLLRPTMGVRSVQAASFSGVSRSCFTFCRNLAASTPSMTL